MEVLAPLYDLVRSLSLGGAPLFPAAVPTKDHGNAIL